MSRTRDYILAGVVGFSAFSLASIWERAQDWLGLNAPGVEQPDDGGETPPEDPLGDEPPGGGSGEDPGDEPGDGGEPPVEPDPPGDADGGELPDAPDGPLTDSFGEAFSYLPPGDLIAGSGEGRVDDTNYAPGIRFPMELPRAFANSQVYNPGGQFGPTGWQCDAINYQYPWRDNFCEDRRFATPFCPSGTGHQGQDIRPPTCPPLDPLDSRPEYWAVAAADGQITGISGHIVTLDADDGTRFLYMHLAPDSLAVDVEDRVSRGERIGVISNYFGGTPTTYHLHLEIRQTVAVDGRLLTLTPVPPYQALVDSYERLLAGEDGEFPAPGE